MHSRRKSSTFYNSHIIYKQIKVLTVIKILSQSIRKIFNFDFVSVIVGDRSDNGTKQHPEARSELIQTSE